MNQSEKRLKNINYAFVLHDKLQGKFKIIHSQLMRNIYQYKVDNIILRNSNYVCHLKKKRFMFNISSLILKLN